MSGHDVKVLFFDKYRVLFYHALSMNGMSCFLKGERELTFFHILGKVA